MQHLQPTLALERPVFVIDDDPGVLGSLKFSLEIEGYTVRTYPNARALAADSIGRRWGCLLVDFNMPEKDGLQLLKELRSTGVTMPAILITSNPGAAVRSRAAADGVPIVEKPFLGNGLVEAIRSAFGD